MDLELEIIMNLTTAYYELILFLFNFDVIFINGSIKPLF